MKNSLMVMVTLLIFQCSYMHARPYKQTPEEARMCEYFCPSEMANLPISDWKNPTYEDYVLIQKHLRRRLDRILSLPTSQRYFHPDFEGWITYRMGRVQLVDTPNNMPSMTVVYINGDPSRKDKCVICYGSYNNAGRDYIQGINYIIKALKAFNFNGHFIYRIGGWPNLKGDRLKFADVPYAFKPFFFEEVRDMGYKRILWLDSASIPVKNLDPVFSIMDQFGCCFFAQGIMSQQKKDMLNYVFRALRISPQGQFLDILSQVVGFNLNNPRAARLLDRWIEAATQKIPFLEPSGDQFSFGLLVHEANLLQGLLPETYYQEGTPTNFNINSGTVILHNYG